MQANENTNLAPQKQTKRNNAMYKTNNAIKQIKGQNSRNQSIESYLVIKLATEKLEYPSFRSQMSLFHQDIFSKST